jgi:hypothetical protein
MNRALFTLLLMIFGSFAIAEDRPKMSDNSASVSRPKMSDNSGELDLKGCIRSAESAANSENLEGFLDCFVPEVRDKIRRPIAFRFVQHAVSMEIIDCHVLANEEESGELVVKYKLKLDTQAVEIVSCIRLTKYEGSWKMQSEKMMSRKDVTQNTFVSSSAREQQFVDFGNGAQVMFDPKEEDYPADIGRHEMGGCVGGRCNLR